MGLQEGFGAGGFLLVVAALDFFFIDAKRQHPFVKRDRGFIQIHPRAVLGRQLETPLLALRLRQIVDVVGEDKLANRQNALDIHDLLIEIGGVQRFAEFRLLQRLYVDEAVAPGREGASFKDRLDAFALLQHLLQAEELNRGYKKRLHASDLLIEIGGVQRFAEFRLLQRLYVDEAVAPGREGASFKDRLDAFALLQHLLQAEELNRGYKKRLHGGVYPQERVFRVGFGLEFDVGAQADLFIAQKDHVEEVFAQVAMPVQHGVDLLQNIAHGATASST